MFQFAIRVFSVQLGSKLPAFDDALNALAAIPRLFIEPDGSFVWPSAPSQRPAWQIDGNLVDGGDVLYYVELKGNCPSDAFDALRNAIARPEVQLQFEWIHSGDVCDEATFRRWLHGGEFEHKE